MQNESIEAAAKAVKFVIVHCELDEQGKIAITKTSKPPYGYHHIYAVDEDNSFLPVAHIFSSVGEKEIMGIAKIIAGEKPTEVSEKFP